MNHFLQHIVYLTARENLLLEHRYLELLSYGEIGRRLGLSTSKVRREIRKITEFVNQSLGGSLDWDLLFKTRKAIHKGDLRAELIQDDLEMWGLDGCRQWFGGRPIRRYSKQPKWARINDG